MTSEPTSDYKPTGMDGGLVLSYPTAAHIADLMLRYGSVEANLRTSTSGSRTAFFASRQHSVYTAEDYLISVKLGDDHPYTYYAFGILHQGGRIYQFDTSANGVQIDEPYMSGAEKDVWNAFLNRLGYELQRLRRERKPDADTEAPAQPGRIRLKLRQNEEA